MCVKVLEVCGMGWDERDHKRFCHLAWVGGGGDLGVKILLT